MVLLLASSAIFKEVRRPLSQGLLPGMDLARVDFKPAGQLCNGVLPLERGKATLALKTGLYFLRVCFMSCSFFPSYFRSGTLSLSHLSEFWGPPQLALTPEPLLSVKVVFFQRFLEICAISGNVGFS